jgi:hypothetical protein
MQPDVYGHRLSSEGCAGRSSLGALGIVALVASRTAITRVASQL